MIFPESPAVSDEEVYYFSCMTRWRQSTVVLLLTKTEGLELNISSASEFVLLIFLLSDASHSVCSEQANIISSSIVENKKLDYSPDDKQNPKILRRFQSDSKWDKGLSRICWHLIP